MANDFFKTLGKLAGSAALKVTEGAAYAVEEVCAATSISTGVDLSGIQDKVYNLRSKSSEKVAEIWDKEPKELKNATGKELVVSVLSSINSSLSTCERKIDEYERNSPNPDRDKIDNARQLIAERREVFAEMRKGIQNTHE